MEKNNTEDTVDKIFEEDEMLLLVPRTYWTQAELLQKHGIFFLKDIVAHLHIDSILIKKRALTLRNMGSNPWEVMGVRKVWNHWMIRMKVFGPYFRKHIKPKYKEMEEGWDTHTLLVQKGVYLLTDVVKLVDFADHQLRYRARKSPNSRKYLGIWKDEDLNLFLVDMVTFSSWLTRHEAKHGTARKSSATQREEGINH